MKASQIRVLNENRLEEGLRLEIGGVAPACSSINELADTNNGRICPIMWYPDPT